MTAMDECFDFIDENMTISKNKKVITNNSGKSWLANYKTAYCSSSLSPNRNQTLIGKFKINKCWQIEIGIEYGKYRSVKDDFSDIEDNPDGEFYAYRSENGNKRSYQDDDINGKPYGDMYGDGDIISMKLEFLPKAEFGNLYFSKNNGEYKNTQYQLPRNKPFRVAVCLCSSTTKSEVELIAFIKANNEDIDNNDNDNDDEKKENKNNKNTDQFHSNLDLNQMVNELQTQLLGKVSQINELQNIVQTQKHKMDETIQEDQRQQTMIITLQQEIEQYKQNLNKLSAQKQEEEKKNEYESSEQNIKTDLLYLEKELSKFVENYDKNKLLTVFNESPETLVVNDEITALDLRLRSFGKHLIDLKSYIESLITPDTAKYTEWNMHDMIQWISILEKGRYKKYVNVFRAGFESDGIDSGNYLPDLTQDVLRGNPFNITNFGDRRDLANHFQILRSQQVINNDDNINDEGTFTEYH